MFTTYILQNDKTGKFYIGSTNNIERRIKEHNRGQTRSTRKEGYWNIVYKEFFESKQEAQKREKLIKSYKGGNAFKSLVAGIVHR